LTISGLSVDVINIISWARGIGTLRITIGATNTDIVLSDMIWTNTKSIVSLTSQTSVTITCTSGEVYVKNVSLFDTALSSYEDAEIQEDFLHTFPLAETKYYRDAIEGEIYYRNTFIHDQADGTNVLPQGMTAGTGSFKINTFSLEFGEQVINGDFNSSAGWLGAAVVISGGVATLTNSADGVRRADGALVVGKKYKAEYKINSISAGGLFLRLDLNGFSGTTRTTAGTYTEEFTHVAGSAPGRIELRQSTTVTAVVEYLSIIEIPPLQNFDTGINYLECTAD